MKKVIQIVLAWGVISIGIYMMIGFESTTAPFMSGIGFVLVGVSLWLPNCPICNKLCKK